MTRIILSLGWLVCLYGVWYGEKPISYIGLAIVALSLQIEHSIKLNKKSKGNGSKN